MKLKILIVDDEPQIRKQLKIGLSGYGYEVITVANEQEALTLTATTDAGCHHSVRSYAVEKDEQKSTA